MSNEFDFRIKQSVYRQALEIYRKMEALLQTEKENQQNNALTMKQNWASSSADTFLRENNLFLENGNYRSAYEQVKSMREVIEDTLPEVNALLARCEGFYDQLNSDSYVEPIKPAGDDATIRNGGILSLNYDMIAVIKDRCDIISEENHTLRDTLKSIMNECRGEIDGTDSYLAELETASKKIDRVINYRDSFQKYEAGIRALEFDLNVRLGALTQNTKEMYDIAGISEAELKSGIQDLEDIYNPLYMSEQELEAVMQQFLAEGNIAGMQQVANQIFAQDVNDWNDAETEFIAETLNYGFERNELELIEGYISQMLKEEYTKPVMQNTHYNIPLYSSYYEVSPDKEKIQLVMNCLNARSQGLTYYTLNRIQKIQIEKIKVAPCNPNGADGCAYTICTELNNGKIEIICSTKNVKGNKETQYKMTAYDMQEVINFEKEVELVMLGFTPKQVEEMRINIMIDEEILKTSAWINDSLNNELTGLTVNDITNVIKSSNNDKIYLSDKKNSIFYKGKVYEIYVPDYLTVSIDSPKPWTEVAKIEKTSKEFDCLVAITGFEYDDIDRVGENDKVTWTIGQTWLLGLGALNSINKATTFNTVSIQFLERSGEQKAVISINNSQTSATLTTHADGKIHSKIEEQKSVADDYKSNKFMSDYCQYIYLLANNMSEEDWDKNGVYDIVYTVDERHVENNCIGYISFEKENMIYTPLVFGGDTMKIAIRDNFSVFSDSTEICDISDKLSQSSILSEEYQGLFEEIINQAYENE